jgi:GNAT superfamily N-acetyltransferase
LTAYISGIPLVIPAVKDRNIADCSKETWPYDTRRHTHTYTYKMSVREATYEDLLPASKILAAAFRNERLFGGLFHPYREQFPDDMHLFFLQKLRVDWARTSTPDMRIVLASPPQEPASIAGVAIWQRKRATPTPDSEDVAAKVREMEALNAAEAESQPNRAADPAHHTILAESEKFMKHHWSGSRAESWYLDLLGVDPKQGGHGYGKLLVKYGFELARAENVGASVISALDRESYYTMLGFDVTVGTVRDFGGEENPFVSRPDLGGTIHFWDGGREPVGLKGYRQ